MQEIKKARQRLESALETGDLEAVREAGRALVASCATDTQATGSLAQAGRLADLGLLASATVHELRQPLAGIKAMAQLITSAADTPPALADKLAAIERSAQHMEAICNRLRGYARGETKEHQPGQVNEAVRGALELLQSTLRRVVIEGELADDLPPVALDQTALQQIVLNLVRNAGEALTGGTGQIRISTRCQSDRVEVVVADNGPGVSPEMRERLFAPFASGKDLGSGLGLYMSRRLAEEAGGRLELVAESPGACFRLVVPVAGASPHA